MRGGGELGRAWHEAATRSAKLTSVTDLEACADWLAAAGLAAAGRLALVAESAGGLTAGAALVRRPGAYGAAVLQASMYYVHFSRSVFIAPLNRTWHLHFGHSRTERGHFGWDMRNLSTSQSVAVIMGTCCCYLHGKCVS